MNFVFGLPHTLKKNDFIFVLINCFLKMSYFISYTKIIDFYTIVKLYLNEIKLYDLSKTIVLDKDA